MNTKDLDKIKQRIEKELKSIGEKRDALRDILEDLESYVDSLDNGEDSLIVAREELDRAIDTISQYI